MRLAGIIAVSTLLLTGCSDPAPPPDASTPTSTADAFALPTPTTTAATERPSSPLSPDGFGASPPTDAQLQDLADWMDGPGRGANRATDDVNDGLDRVTAAISAQDIDGLITGCRQITDPLTIRLPASVPTPDPDMTTALTWLIEDGEKLAAACGGLTDPPTGDQLDAVSAGLSQLGSDLMTTGTIIQRNGDLLVSEASRLERGGN